MPKTFYQITKNKRIKKEINRRNKKSEMRNEKWKHKNKKLKKIIIFKKLIM